MWAQVRIVFIGPSTSKFDYLALAYFAEYGSWPVEDKVPIGNGESGPNPMYEWNVREVQKAGGPLPPAVQINRTVPGCIGGGGTETFMRYTNHILHGHEVCDCHQNGNWKGPGDYYNSTENRVYVNNGLVLSYFQWFGDTVSPRGTADISQALGGQPQTMHLQCPVGQFPGSWAWTQALSSFLTNVIQYANPTHLVISAAFWPSPPSASTFWDDLAQAGTTAVQRSKGAVFWRTTPQRMDKTLIDPASSVNTQRFLDKGWHIFPAQQIVANLQGSSKDSDIYYDYTHLKPVPATNLVQNWLQQNVCPTGAQ